MTTLWLPAIGKGELVRDRARVLQGIRRRFVRQARAAVLVAGMTGLYLIARFDL
jgi:hypothetical protein